MITAFNLSPPPCHRVSHPSPSLTPRRIRPRHALPTRRRTRPPAFCMSTQPPFSDEERAAAAAASPSSRNSESMESYLQCVECAAVYVVEPEELEGAPRVVGCSACLHEWYASESDLLWGEEDALSALAAHASFEAKSRSAKVEGQKAMNAAKGVENTPKKQIRADLNGEKKAEESKMEKGKVQKGLKSGASEVAATEKHATIDRTPSGSQFARTRTETGSDDVHFNVFVGNLSFRATEEDLYRAFSGYGAVLRCQVPADPSGASRGYGFVEMRSRESALRAIKALQGTSIMGRDISLNEARPRREPISSRKQHSRTSWASRNRSKSRDLIGRAGDARNSSQSGFRKDKRQQKEGTKDRLKYSKNS